MFLFFQAMYDLRRSSKFGNKWTTECVGKVKPKTVLHTGLVRVIVFRNMDLFKERKKRVYTYIFKRCKIYFENHEIQ